MLESTALSRSRDQIKALKKLHITARTQDAVKIGVGFSRSTAAAAVFVLAIGVLQGAAAICSIFTSLSTKTVKTACDCLLLAGAKCTDSLQVRDVLSVSSPSPPTSTLTGPAAPKSLPLATLKAVCPASLP